MQSLPEEVLCLIIAQLHRSSRWPFARTCKALYGAIRPSLFRVISIKLWLSSNLRRLDAQYLKLCKEILKGTRKQQGVGKHVETLIVLFKEDDTYDRRFIGGPGAVKALASLLQTTPNLRELVINGMPDCAAPPGASNSYTMGIQDFEDSLRQLENLHSLECASEAGKDSHIWLQAILSSLPLSLHQLTLMPDFEELYLGPNQPNPFTKFLGLIRELYFSCPQVGRACDHLLSSILDNSPLLVKIWIAEQHLSHANLIASFGSERQYEHLTIETVDIPRVPECRHGLSQQTNIRHLDVRCGSDFLYYLAFLPASLDTLKLSILISDSNIHYKEASLDEVWSQVKFCLENPAWCPRLAYLHIDLHTEAIEEEYEALEQEAEEMRDQLQMLLGKRDAIPSTNSDSGSFEPDLSKAEMKGGWKAGLREIKRMIQR